MIKAFVVMDETCTVEKVRENLKKLIPSYMMPRQIIAMDNLPVNSNGKINRKRLIEL